MTLYHNTRNNKKTCPYLLSHQIQLMGKMGFFSNAVYSILCSQTLTTCFTVHARSISTNSTDNVIMRVQLSPLSYQTGLFIWP